MPIKLPAWLESHPRVVAIVTWFPPCSGAPLSALYSSGVSRTSGYYGGQLCRDKEGVRCALVFSVLISCNMRVFYLLVFNISFGSGQDWEGKRFKHYKNKTRRFLQLTESGVSVGSLAVQLVEDITEDWEEERCCMSVKRIMFCLEKGQEHARRMAAGLAMFHYAVRFNYIF